MDQQLLQQTIQIKPSTMDQILPQLINILCQHCSDQIQTSHNDANKETILQSIVKSLFHGLWNFDKMINQHNLSTKIAEIMTIVPENVAFKFFTCMIEYLHLKYNLIDKHRINKFMQLIRYLVTKAMEVNQSKTDNVLKEIVFSDVTVRSGMAYHIIDLYFQVALATYNNKKSTASGHKKVVKNKHLPYKNLQLFEDLLQSEKTLEHIRLHMIEKIYEKYKSHIIEVYGEDQPEIMENKIAQFNSHVMELAQNQEKDHHRKNLYTLVGFMKSDQLLFANYLREKQQKAQREKEKRVKKISKHKKKIIKQAKTKRKQMNKKKRKPDTISKRKFEMAASNMI